MKRLVLHVLPAELGRWKIEEQGEDSSSVFNSIFGDSAPIPDRTFPTKATARAVAREICRTHKPSQLIEHYQTGEFQRERTYGNDPKKYEG